MDETNNFEDRLRQEQRQLETIFSQASLGLCLTRNRQIMRCNPAMEAMFGFASGGLAGFPSVALFESQHDYQAFADTVRPLLEAGRSVSQVWTFRHSTGRKLICKVSANAVNPSPQDEGTVWFFEDITQEEGQAEALAQTLLEFEAIMANAPVAILFTRDRCITRCNTQCCTMFGRTEAEMVGLPGRALFASNEDYEALGRIAGPLLASGQSVIHEMIMARQDGSSFWAQLIAYVLDPADTAKGTIWLVSDRSDARIQEQAIREALMENQAILDSALIGIVYLKDRVIQRCNPYVERIFGYAPGTMTGSTTRDWYLSQEEYDAVATEVYPAIAKGATHAREQRLRRKNGDAFWCRIVGRVFDKSNPLVGGSIWVIEDTTERHAAQEALIGATALMQAVFNSANVSIIATDPAGVITLMNATAERWLGYSADALIMKQTPGIMHDRDEVVAYAAQLSEELGKPIAPGFDVFVARAQLQGSDEREWTYIAQDGRRFPIHLSVTALRDFEGEITGYIGVGIDITDRRRADEAVQRAQEELEAHVALRTAELAEANVRLQQEIVEHQQAQEAIHQMAHYDALTGLPNRNLLHDRIAQALSQAKRKKEKVGILFVDLDHFKTINDSLGHQVGDLLLAQVAQRMSYVLRTTDTLARLGGDEFLLLVPSIESESDLVTIAEKLIEVLIQPIPVQCHSLHITPSIGICHFPQDGEDSETLMRNADTAMYHAKAQGRNGYQFFASHMNAEVDDRFRMESQLRYAISRDELSIHYQPLIDAATQRIHGAEALLRWNSRVLGSVSPARFIPAAEDSGSIVLIGAWVLEQACRQLKAWHALGHDHLVLAVNLSPRQFRQTDLVSMITRILKETGLPPASLELEITESSLMHNVSEVIAKLQQLVGLGVRLAIDDFGTGYSSLAYLKNFPVHKLKIDQSFVRDLTSGEQSVGIVRTIISLAQNLRLDVLAEGVETAEQHRQLVDLGCQYLQGYLFARPMPAADLLLALQAEKDKDAAG
ncbi:bifunctional diguanylate cyclase/phosphodiesterase [Dechloromonas sp. HYN0024]|uniref:bifunctional diguanylate cyclase/phosphodiesterase n=1 Tax=Dechloromonas sp. HYN0024 TaxID=2231055 RepID=UPI000E43C03A|nr:bifunctional diguanylate cyclase/phosphodiesterase [Dechloromonas sp. HYN0024]AXS79447.1 EAL domain-containing protein [Dechloromonas sp. HYN0024]